MLPLTIPGDDPAHGVPQDVTGAPDWACWDEPKLVWALWSSPTPQCDLLSLRESFRGGLGSALGTPGFKDLWGIFPPKWFYNCVILSLLLWLAGVWSSCIRGVESLHTWKFSYFFPNMWIGLRGDYFHKPTSTSESEVKVYSCLCNILEKGLLWAISPHAMTRGRAGRVGWVLITSTLKSSINNSFSLWRQHSTKILSKEVFPCWDSTSAWGCLTLGHSRGVPGRVSSTLGCLGWSMWQHQAHQSSAWPRCDLGFGKMTPGFSLGNKRWNLSSHWGLGVMRTSSVQANWAGLEQDLGMLPVGCWFHLPCPCLWQAT